jgi:iron complex outermembrane receptor protein
MKKQSLHVAIAALVAGYAAGNAPVAYSQQGGAAAPGGLEEIVVTASRREQNLQDVPLAVQAFTGEMLQRQGIENVENLKAVVPNLVVAGNLGGSDTAQFTIRGIPNVGTYVDGIWQVSNNGLLLREFVDLDRVEVLRGPQGTLYGRDSTGGAIRLYTKAPGKEFGGQVDMSVGNLNRHDVKGMLDIPITDKFRTRWTLGTYQRDGYITSLTTGAKTGAFQDQIGRADFIWEPTDRVSLRFNTQSDRIVDTQARVNTYIDPQIGFNSGYQMGLSLAYDVASGGQWNCHYTCSGYPGGLVGKWEGRQDITVPSREFLDQQSADLKVQMTDKIKFEYLVGHTHNDSRQYNDWDAGQFNFYIDYFLSKLDLTSHEFQFSGGNDRFTWVGGVYHWDQKGRSRNPAYSMADWSEANVAGTPVCSSLQTTNSPCSYSNFQPRYSYTNQVLPSAACQMTPAQRGITSWNPGIAAGYVPAFAAALNSKLNTVQGWPFPCGFISGFPGAADWVTVLAGGARPPAGDRLNGDETNGTAVFGEIDLKLGKKFDLILGYRHHKQSADQYAFDLAAGIAAGVTADKPPGPNLEFTRGGIYDGIRIPGGQHVAFDADTYRATGSWHLTDNVMLYVGYSEGFNSGGLAVYTDSLGPVSNAYDPESIKNHEVGLRSDLFDRKLRLNATYFTTDWIGIQLLATVKDRAPPFADLTELVPRNAASAKVDGYEVELTYAATANFLVQANLGWLNTRYTDSQSPAVSLNTEFAQAPDHTYDFGIQHTGHLKKGGTLVTRIDDVYTAAYWRSATPSLRQDAYGVPRSKESGDFWRLDAQLAFTPAQAHYTLTLYGTNLTNVYDLNSGFLHNIWQFDFATVSRPREVGATFRVNF